MKLLTAIVVLSFLTACTTTHVDSGYVTQDDPINKMNGKRESSKNDKQ